MTEDWTIEGPGIRLELGRRTHIMGILNVTPDSFSDGGAFLTTDAAVAHAHRMAEDGADILDVGGESTRPGAVPVPLDEELRRVLPVIERLARSLPLPVSIDTRKAEVARRAIEAGARIVNDVSGFTADPEMAGTVAASGVPIVLMHSKGTPGDMQRNPYYQNTIQEITDWFEHRLDALTHAGIPRDRVILDPGIGFGKRVSDNLLILRSLRAFATLCRPLLVGPSRKSFIGKILGVPEHERLEGTAAAVALAVANGAQIVRVHDVQAMTRVARIADAITRAEPS